MQPHQISIPEPIRHQLRDALVFEQDLLQIVRAQQWEPLVDRSGLFQVTCAMAIPRQMDPETSELRLLEVYLRSVAEDQARIVRIDGLAPVDPA